MDQELKEKLLSYVNNAEAFLSAEIPAFFTEYVNYHFYAALLSLSLSITLILFLLYVMYSSNNSINKESFEKTTKDFKEGYYVFLVFLNVIGAILIFIQSVCVYSSSVTMIKTSVAPRVFVFDKILELQKK